MSCTDRLSCSTCVANNAKKVTKVVVIGDGAVGQCAVIAAKMREHRKSSSMVATKTVNRWPWSQARQQLSLSVVKEGIALGS